MEVILLFVTLACFVFIIKRNILGAIIYFITYGLYFGTDLYNGIMKMIGEELQASEYFNMFISTLGVIIPLLTVFDILLNKNRKGSVKDEKTDWFYTNKEYERKLDERADDNQYKF